MRDSPSTSSLRTSSVLAWSATMLLAGSCASGTPSEAVNELVGATTNDLAPGAIVCSESGRPWTSMEASRSGKYSVGSLDLDLVDSSRGTPAHGSFAGSSERKLPTTVWYPRLGLFHRTPPSGFPIVMYSHGFVSNRDENSGLARHLASHGFVVVAPTFPASNTFARGGPTPTDAPNQPGDVRYALDRVLALGATRGHVLEGRLDASRIAAVGFSLGGLTTLLVAFHPTLHDSRIDVAVAMAPPAGLFTQRFYESVDLPVLVIHGTDDALISYVPHATTFREEAVHPAALLTLDTGTHVGFTSISGLLALLGSSNVDRAGCLALGLFLDEAGDFSGFFEPLGGESAGVQVPPPGFACPDDFGEGMSPSRQLAITNAAVLSFLSAYLDADPATRGRACGFFARSLAAGDDLDLWQH